jgi:protein NirF
VFKMPHLRGWSMAQGRAYLPAIGRHEVLVVDGSELAGGRPHPGQGQPVFVMARPDGRQVWVNFAFPDNGWVR